MKIVTTTLILIGLLFSQQAVSQVVSPASVTASSTFASYSLPDLINGAGITGGLDGGTHTEDYFTMWMSSSGDVTPQLVFDMGAVASVSAARIWQYNAACCGLDRGVNDFDIYYSDDNSNYTFFGSFNLSQSGGGDISAQIVPLSFSARYIRFEVTSNHGGESYTGLSEVAFDIGDLQSSKPTLAVPSLSSLMLMVLILLVAGMAVVQFRSYRLSHDD